MADQESRDGLPPGYWEACRLAERGESDQARRLHAELEDSATAAAAAGSDGRRLRALIRNDLAVLAALEGRSDEARRGWAEAREIDAACLPPHLNDDFLAALLDFANPNPGPDDLGQPLVLNFGTVLLRTGRLAEAASAYRQALRDRPDHRATYLHLGSALRSCGRPAEAAAAWEQASRLRPADPPDVGGSPGSSA